MPLTPEQRRFLGTARSLHDPPVTEEKPAKTQSPEKTRIAHLDEGFDFLGFRIQRHRQWGSERRHVYSYPSKKSRATIRRKVKAVTAYPMTGLPARAGGPVAE